MKKKTEEEGKKTNVNLGCGDHIIPGWINIDNYRLPEKNDDFLQGDLRDLPLEKDSVDYILCDNVLEHIPMSDIPTVLHEMRRVLKKGGRAVIMVPDFESAVKDFLSIDHQVIGSYNPFVYNFLTEVIYGNQLHEGEYHKTALTPAFLHYALNMVGLKKHGLVLHLKNGPIPTYPGMREVKGGYLRNSQLAADIIKTQ